MQAVDHPHVSRTEIWPLHIAALAGTTLLKCGDKE